MARELFSLLRAYPPSSREKKENKKQAAKY